ncbi:MAG: thiamine phosphate synthase [Clostridia bacterium]|nr:thiamine phosphate synthase [Clostridia bacterium]
MRNKTDYSLYLVTDQKLMSSPTLQEGVEAALLGGCTMVQLREKDASSLLFYETAVTIKKISDRFGVPLIINDRADIALAVDASGLHVGQSDLPVAVARRLIGPDRLLGASVSTLAEAQKAVADGADYLGVGAMFATATKDDADLVTMETLAAIRKAVSVPLVVIGGINAKTAPSFAECGIDGLAVVSAILSQPDITRAAQNLLQIFKGLK